MISDAIKQAQFLIRLKSKGDFLTPDTLESVALDTLKIFPDVDKELLKKHLMHQYSIFQEKSETITKDYTPWIKQTKSEISLNFWPRYQQYLEEYKNFPTKTLLEIDNTTDDTLDHLHNPRSKDNFDKRGMVVGHVQSGKTANFSGLICKAADVGYKFIIVLAGIHNSLRAQTQVRIDESVLGYDNQHYKTNKEMKYVGVGNFIESRSKAVAHSITTSQSDFNTTTANSIGINFDTNEPIIAVVKKNASILQKLTQWLESQATEIEDGKKLISNKPLLIIDDEADNASLNTNKEDLDPTRINSQIRNILKLFKKKSYVGYTATPFANVFVQLNEDDLFPRNFITNLKAPSNYIGPDKIFGFESDSYDERSTLSIINKISDYEDLLPDGHKKEDPLPNILPTSLKTAIKCFIITCAIRRCRGQVDVHNSMLVHVSRFQIWQSKVKELVEEEFNFYRRGIEQNNKDVLDEIRRAFELDGNGYKSYRTVTNEILESELREIDPYIETVDWLEVEKELHPAATKILVKEIHGGAKDTLDYFDNCGVSVIAIGGNKLSRGLTLEGLSISYYLRSSKMYDTLMQMGRWFGYRPGYVDLCRLFTAEHLVNWFSHITKASEELRREFNYMTKVAGSTPEQYALRVRTHPENVLQISARNKIRKAIQVELSWAGRLIQSYELEKNSNTILNNFNAYEKFVSKLGDQYTLSGNNKVWYNIPASDIREFLHNFKVPPGVLSSSPGNLSRYIDEANTQGELTEWRLGLMSRNKSSTSSDVGHHTIGWFSRKNQNEPNSSVYYVNKSNITSRPDEFIDMGATEKQLYLEKNIARWKESSSNKPKPTNPNGETVRNEFRKPDKPLMLLYLLNPEEAGLTDEVNPFVGFAISFPGSDKLESVSFAIHADQIPNFDFEVKDEDYEDED
jgi:hypothetical protein